jgi:hypothetical protein
MLCSICYFDAEEQPMSFKRRTRAGLPGPPAGGSAAVGAALAAHPDRRRQVATLARWLGALALLGVGIDHVEQYAVDSYSAIPTIGTLFLLNFVSATVVSLALIAPVHRVAGRWTAAVRAMLALGGIAIAAGSVAGLLVSEGAGLFGFVEQGYRFAIALSLALEIATVLLLATFVAATGPAIWPPDAPSPR